MAHWAELDDNNVVLRITVGDNNEPDEGYQWLIDNLGGRWVQTSYNNNIRVRFARPGDSYNEELDAFLYPQCHDEAVLNETTCDWDCSNAAHDVEV